MIYKFFSTKAATWICTTSFYCYRWKILRSTNPAIVLSCPLIGCWATARANERAAQEHYYIESGWIYTSKILLPLPEKYHRTCNRIIIIPIVSVFGLIKMHYEFNRINVRHLKVQIVSMTRSKKFVKDFNLLGWI